MQLDRANGLTYVLGTAGAAALIAFACSTAAEPADEGTPECECPVGERELVCNMRRRNPETGATQDGWNLGAGFICVDENASDEDKEDACFETCESHVVEPWVCEWHPAEDENFFFTGCIAPTGGTGSGGFGGGGAPECAGWYIPEDYVLRLSLTSSYTLAHLIRPFVRQIRRNMEVLYACDEARYKEPSGSGSWTFINVDSADFLYLLGVRTDDENARVQAFDPSTFSLMGSQYPLDSKESMYEAYWNLVHADGVRVTVDRSGAPGGVYHLWITLAEAVCEGSPLACSTYTGSPGLCAAQPGCNPNPAPPFLCIGSRTCDQFDDDQSNCDLADGCSRVTYCADVDDPCHQDDDCCAGLSCSSTNECFILSFGGDDGQ